MVCFITLTIAMDQHDQRILTATFQRRRFRGRTVHGGIKDTACDRRTCRIGCNMIVVTMSVKYRREGMWLPAHRAVPGASARFQNAYGDKACTQVEKESAFHTF